MGIVVGSMSTGGGVYLESDMHISGSGGGQRAIRLIDYRLLIDDEYNDGRS